MGTSTNTRGVATTAIMGAANMATATTCGLAAQGVAVAVVVGGSTVWAEAEAVSEVAVAEVGSLVLATCG